MHLDCRSLEYQTLPLPENVVIIVADTGVRHSLVGSAYNDRRAACEQAVELLKRDLPEIRALRDVSPRTSIAWRADCRRKSRNAPGTSWRRSNGRAQAVPLLQSGDIARLWAADERLPCEPAGSV